MSDSSSVDRWHPSNVETLDPANAESESWGVESVAKSDYEALYADRGRVLAAARELARILGGELLARILGGELYAYDEGDDGWETITAALASFREVDQ